MRKYNRCEVKSGVNPLRKLYPLLFFAVFLVIPGTLISRSEGFQDFKKCSGQCRGFTGSMKIKCIETCARVSRGEKSRESPNENFRQCDEFCKIFKGIDNVRCVRICLEKIKKKEKKSGNGNLKPGDPCSKRCSVFNEPMKSRCIKRCGRENKPGTRSVW